MAELIPVDASSPPCPLDVAVALQEDDTSVPLSSLEMEVFVDPNHPNKVLEGLNKLRLNNASCDVTLCCEGQEFPCHRYVLASFTSYFEAMFINGMVESTQKCVAVSGVDPQMIALLLSYAYTAKVSISTANVQALLVASDFLDVTAVREACCDYIERHMDVNNCVGIYCLAETHSFKVLEKQSMDYIFENFSVIYQQEEFLSLSVDRLTEILASDHLNVAKEDMVFEAAMLWLDKCATRRLSFEKVLEHIRLPLISPSYIHTVIESLDVMKEYQGCQRFISEAKNQALVPYCNTARPRRTPVIVMVGGQTDYEEFHKVESYDPLTRQWKTLGRLPTELRGIREHAVVLSGSVLYLAGGYFRNDDFTSRDMWRYDVPHNSWLKMAPMIKKRDRFSMVMLDGYVVAVGGDSGADSIEHYNPKTNTWQLTKSVGVWYYGYNSPAVIALDGHLYFIGSYSSIKEKPELALMAKYNPETSVWTELAPMQIPRDRASACAVNGKIYLTGGVHDTVIEHRKYCAVEDTMECYNPQTNQWNMCAPMQVPHKSPNLAVVDGKIYVLGGHRWHDEIEITGKIEQYCEETNTWETVGQMPTACYNLNCVTLRLRNDHPPAVEDDENNEDERYYSRLRRRHKDDSDDG